MIKVAEMTAQNYWLSFCSEWNNLAIAAHEAGQDGMADFFAELSDDAADVWAGLYGPLN